MRKIIIPAAVGLVALPGAAEAQSGPTHKVIVDVSPRYENVWTAGSRFGCDLNRNPFSLSLGAEHFYLDGPEPDVTSAAIRAAIGPISARAYAATGPGDPHLEGKFVYF